MTSLAFLVCSVILVYACLGASTLALLACLRLLGWPGAPQYGPARTDMRFAVVVPAHDEQECIESTLRAIAALDYPGENFQAVVVADNCTDATAEKARQAGARVIERRDPALRGKGYALRHAFDILLAEPFDAVVVIDADTRPAPGLLKAFSAALASGVRAAQCRYGADNAQASPLSWLLVLGNVLENDFRHDPRARLGLPTILRGNGMCFAARVLRDNPWQAFSITEDTEYGLTLLENGVPVAYLGGVEVTTRLPENMEQLRIQRARWAAGNSDLARTRAPRLLAAALARRNWLLADAAWSLMTASLPQLALAALLPALAGLVLPGGGALAAWGAATLAALGFVLLAGVASMGGRGQALRSLRAAPGLLWCLTASLVSARFGRGERTWARTKRS